MPGVDAKSFDEPDELLQLPLLTIKTVLLAEVHVAWVVHEPGWSWSEHLKPVVGTPSCLHHHQGVQLSGGLEVTTDAGARRVVRRGEVYDIPPAHDARVLGDEPVLAMSSRARGAGRIRPSSSTSSRRSS